MTKFEKTNHHYIPQYWLRGFRGDNGRLYSRSNSGTKQVSTKNIMRDDWLYTVFDEQWNPSDALEDALAIVEGDDAKLFQRLHTPGYITTNNDRNELCAVLALQASRHPDVLGRSLRLAKEVAALFADAPILSLEEFQRRSAPFGLGAADAQNYYVALRSRTKEQLFAELAELNTLSPQSPKLPTQDSLRAEPIIAEVITRMDLCLLEAPPPMAFVLGSRPKPVNQSKRSSQARLHRQRTSRLPCRSRRQPAATQIST